MDMLAGEGAADNHADRIRLQAASPEAGYVYFSVSSAMPGFVQLATSAEDPRGRKWALRTPSGVTRFRNVCAFRTSDCRGLEAQFRRALRADQIPHHPDLFKFPVRFARQILAAEAKAFPPPPEPSTPPKLRAYVFAMLLAAMLAVPFAFQFHRPPAPKIAPAYRHPVPQMRL